MVWNKKVKTKRGILSGQAAYNAWLGGGIDSINITRDTLILRDLLQERYPGLLVYSLYRPPKIIYSGATCRLVSPEP